MKAPISILAALFIFIGLLAFSHRARPAQDFRRAVFFRDTEEATRILKISPLLINSDGPQRGKNQSFAGFEVISSLEHRGGPRSSNHSARFLS